MLKLTLTLDADKFAPGQTVSGKLTLQNVGQETLLVNSRLAINKSFAPDPFREVYFNLRLPSGDPGEFLLKINIGEPTVDDFQQLAPGESADQPFDLDMYFLLEQLGEHTVQAVYENQAEPGDGRQAWTGKLESDPVSFQLAS